MTIYAIMAETEHTTGVFTGSMLSSGTYASTLSDNYSMKCIGVDYADVPLNQSISDVWMHAHIYINQNSQGNANDFLQFINSSSGLPQITLRGNDVSPMTFSAYLDSGSGLSALTGSFTVPNTTEVDFDVHVKIHSTLGEISVYINGVSAYSYTGDTSTVNNNFDNVKISSYSDSTFYSTNWSQIILADEPTIGWLLDTLRATSNDSLGSWSGDFSAIDEVDYTASSDFISSDTSADIATFGHNGYDTSIDTSTYVVRGVVVSSSAAIQSGSTVTDMSHAVKVGATVYPSTALGMTGGGVVDNNQTLWDTNPATSSAWTFTDLNALKFGVKNS